MESQTLPTAPPLGHEGEPCARCSTPLGADQRYCLTCGQRRGPARLPFLEVVGVDARAGAGPGASSRPAAPGERSPLVALGSLIALLLALGTGVLIGRGAADVPAPVARTPIVTVAAPPAAATAGTAPAAFTSDWPAGSEGYTVALQTLAAGTPAADVAAAKQAAADQGASDVGALKSDEFPSLDPGQILVYAGNFPARGAANSARRGLRASFPDARVVHVASTAEDAATAKPPAKTGAEEAGSGAADQGTSGTGAPSAGYGKSTNKVPEKVVTPGKAPPVDDAAPGGDSAGDATEIG